MPSYYDSKKKKPGKADMQYNKGGKVEYDKKELGSIKKMIADQNAIKDAASIAKQIRKERADKLRLDKAYKTASRLYGLRASRGDTEKNIADKLQDAVRGAIGESSIDKARREARKDVLGFKKGGKVKKMKGGGTVARGSGAARPQTFRKNG